MPHIHSHCRFSASWSCNPLSVIVLYCSLKQAFDKRLRVLCSNYIARDLDKTREQFMEKQILIGVIGFFNTGKSTLLNSLLRARLAWMVMSTLYIVNFESVCKPKLPLLYYICKVIELRQYSIALFHVWEGEECLSNFYHWCRNHSSCTPVHLQP